MGHDRDTSFYVATVTFLVEDRLFRVPRAPFEQESSVFLDMFSIPQGDKAVVEGLCDENPIRLDGVTKDDFEQLLKALFCRQNGSQPPLPDNVKQWTSVLKLSTMWDFQIVRQSAIRALDSLQIDPVDRVALAQQYDIQEWLVPALNELAKRLEPISFEEGCRMGFDTALKLASLGLGSIVLYLDFRNPNARPRPFSNDGTSASDDLKQKPKAATPLRRTASASLPIRSNPTPTRSSIRPVLTFATAERYVPTRLRACLPAHSQKLHDAWWVPRWGERGEIFVFPNGSFVCWGTSETEARRFAKEVLAPCEIGSLREAETESLDFVTDPNEKTRIQGDLIILGRVAPLQEPDSAPAVHPPDLALDTTTLLARYAFSQALSRSTALAVLEESLEDYLSSVAQLPHSLEKTGKPGLSREALIKKLGSLLKFRQGLNLNRENFSDTPDLYWAEPELEGLFKSMSSALEVKTRTNAVNEKITYATEVQSILRQLLTESTAHRMELVIIALIAVEVVIALIRDGPELWHMAFGPQEKCSENDGSLPSAS
ncbi:hypothetical protein ID866_5558 [Astraeus odoratus]|nr:hypothetical protein ID866_5558 [Astraeus odoratus]